MKLFFFLIAAVTLILFSCTSNEIGNSKDVNPDAIYFDYKIWANEKDSNVAVYLQYRMGGPNGTTLILNDPAKVEIDNEPVTVDSSKFGGAFYEVQKPVRSFTGNHTILFTDLHKKEYKENFSFTRFTVRTKIPSVVKRGDLVFDLDGFDPADYVRVIATDTSFTSKDIHEIDTVKNGRLIIRADKLKDLVNGPITLQLSKESEKPVKNGTKEGGRISVSYGIQREFILKD